MRTALRLTATPCARSGASCNALPRSCVQRVNVTAPCALCRTRGSAIRSQLQCPPPLSCVQRVNVAVTELEPTELDNWRRYLDYEENQGDFQRTYWCVFEMRGYEKGGWSLNSSSPPFYSLFLPPHPRYNVSGLGFESLDPKTFKTCPFSKDGCGLSYVRELHSCEREIQNRLPLLHASAVSKLRIIWFMSVSKIRLNSHLWNLAPSFLKYTYDNTMLF
jgi:hypothetical protein